ncbi:MAG: hypothetical protein QNJ58_00505 [Desulfobacterales bacterium]|nr:hypothetical protein [Desulfobacterales bacterium]
MAALYGSFPVVLDESELSFGKWRLPDVLGITLDVNLSAAN